MQADELVRAALAGDQRAWAKLYRLVDGGLRGYFTRRFPTSDVDDLVQTTLAEVLTKLDLFQDRGDSAFMRWVYGFAKFVAHKSTRRESRRNAKHAALQHNERPPSTSLSSKIELMQKLAIVRGELGRLSDAQRRAIENDLAGRSSADLAEAENIGQGSARMLRSRARRKLGELVRERMANPRPRTPAPPTPTPTRTPTPTPAATRTPTK